jgi:peptidoglycan/xylan/chitin deacetylase (PgdA/CDA1 family)
MPAVRRVLGNRGAILIFHDVQECPRGELMEGTDVTFLDHALVWLKDNGWEVTSLDEGLRRLMQEDGGPRFVVLTFDDGYRDNVTRALPILELHDAPFTIFVPTGAPTRTLYSWWLGLRALFRMCDTVTIDGMDRRFECPDIASKTAALAKVTQWVHSDLRRACMLAPTFAAAGISLSALNDTYFLDENELKELARHPLASIGAHTSSHVMLSTLEPTSVLREMSDNRSYLEQLLQRPIKHFAYPYGGKGACGEREEKIAAEVGFLSAVTTRSAPLTTAHGLRPLFLPRIGFPAKVTTAGLDARVSGLQAAIFRQIGYA